MVIITLLRGLRRKVKTEKLFYFRLLGNYRQVEDNDNNSEHIQRGKNGGKRELSISQNKVNKELILKAIMHQPSTIQNDNNAGSGVVSIYVFVTHLPNKWFAHKFKFHPKRFKICNIHTKENHVVFSFLATFSFLLMNAPVYDYIEQGIHKWKMKVAQDENDQN